jgi:hypothetical protein
MALSKLNHIVLVCPHLAPNKRCDMNHMKRGEILGDPQNVLFVCLCCVLVPYCLCCVLVYTPLLFMLCAGIRSLTGSS